LVGGLLLGAEKNIELWGEHLARALRSAFRQPCNCIAALQAYKVHSGRMLWGGVKTEACPRQPRSVSPNSPEALEQS
ncbi:hypothetical protein, partial [Stutzerimonas kunmingensis]|uniref:hypothetical protein n=1 Tax=Stutzerimonas kunmingensis TaxID=1211807 RepID=UPI00241EC012